MPSAVSTSGPLSFRDLFGRSYAFLKANIHVVLLLALITAVLAALMQWAMSGLPKVPAEAGQVMGTQQMIDWSGASMNMLILFFGLQVLAVIAQFLVHVAMWLLAMVGGGSAGQLLRRAGSTFFPMLGLYIWAFLRSFIWLAIAGAILLSIGLPLEYMPLIIAGGLLIVAGVILSFIIFPRLIASPYVYLSGGRSITAAVQTSYRGTQGYWGKIVGNNVLFALCMFPITIVLSMLASAIVSFSIGTAGTEAAAVAGALFTGLMAGLVQGVLSAFSVFFYKELSATLLQNPRAS